MGPLTPGRDSSDLFRFAPLQSKLGQVRLVGESLIFRKERFPREVWVFPKMGVPQNGWFIMENPIKMDGLGVPLFSETSIWIRYIG